MSDLDLVECRNNGYWKIVSAFICQGAVLVSNCQSGMVCLSFVSILFSSPHDGNNTDAAEIGLAIYSSLMAILMNNFGGVHMWNLTEVQSETVLYVRNKLDLTNSTHLYPTNPIQYFWIETIIYGPFIFFTKLSILLLYLRLLVPIRWSPLWTTIHIFIGASAAFYTAITLVKIFQCSPSEKAYDISVPGHCISIPNLLIVSGLFNTISDAWVLFVPIKACWKLKLSWQKKVGVCAIFTIGAV